MGKIGYQRQNYKSLDVKCMGITILVAILKATQQGQYQVCTVRLNSSFV